ncbi:MAG: hypothetical protein PHS17_16960 [Desulfobacterales bacterium]|nr:hypothetical protein [Desulfobacterales bacterium]
MRNQRSRRLWWFMAGLLAFVLLTGSYAFAADLFDLKMGNVVRIIRMNVDPLKEESFKRWYDMEHEHLLLKVPGVIWAYKGVNLADRGQKWFFMYAHESMAVQKSDQYRAASQTEWAKEIRPALKDFQAFNFEVIVPGSVPTRLGKGAVIRTVQVNVGADHEEEFNKWYDTEHIPALKKVPGVMSIWRAVNLGDKGQKYVTVYFQEGMKVQEREDYRNASQTEWIKSLMPYLRELYGANFEIFCPN